MKNNILNKIRKIINGIGFHLMRSYRVRIDNINLLELGIMKMFHKREKVFFVQVGASDGVTNDPLRKIIEDFKDRITGVCIEPLPVSYSRLVKNYEGFDNIRTLNIAISGSDGPISFYMPNIDGNINLHQKSSLSSVNLKKHGINEKEIKEIKVEGLCVKTFLLKENVKYIDALIIDAEGYDFKILNSFFNVSVFPELLFFEHVHLPKEERKMVRELLNKFNYEFIESMKDILAIKKD